MADKKELREICLQTRNDLSEEERKEKSEIICKKLLPYLEEKTVFSYCPFNNEVDVSMINERFKAALPVIYGGKYMDAWIPNNNEFITNSYGIKEPDPDDAILLDSSDIDVIIVPLLGFDDNKNRLGYGGGYYDRYLEFYEGLKIGVAFAEQKLESIDTDKNDVQLDIIITDKEIIS